MSLGTGLVGDTRPERQMGWPQCQEDLEIRWDEWTLVGPEERLLAQGKAMIHTSCRSESSN